MKKKFLSLFMVIAITIFQFAPTMVSALSYDLTTGNVINSYNVTSDVVTLYIGNVSVDGTSTLKYLYTDKSVNTATLNEIDKILTGDYKTMLPTTAGQIKVSNDNTVTVNDIFTDAGLVAANKYPDGTVTDTSSTILYSTTDYNNLTYASSQEVSDEKVAELANYGAWTTRKTEWDVEEQQKENLDPSYTPVDFPEEYVKAFNDSTTYPTDGYFHADVLGTKNTSYIIRNSVITQVDIYPINRTIIKVVNTSANVTTTKYTVTFDTKGGSSIASQEVVEGQKVTKPSNPTKEGYEFMYWSNADGKNIDDPITANTTFVANWIRKFDITQGADQTFYLESDKDITIVSNGKFSELTGFALFGDNTSSIGIADLTEGTDYILEEGSTKLTLKNSFLKTLGVDKYYVEFYYNGSYGDGYTDTTLLVKSGSEPTTSTEDTTNNSTSGNPQTGDNIMFYISMLGLSIIGLAGVGLYIKKRRFN